jgi:excisionase family DNA binding protein
MKVHEVVRSAPPDLLTELDKRFYSPGEVARLAGLHPSTILNYIHSGRLYAVKLSDRTYRIPNRAVRKMLAPETVRPPRIIDRPDEIVDLAEADREPEWPWPEG